MKGTRYRIPVLALFLLFGLSARAQVVILNDNMLADRLSRIQAVVVDSLSNEPIPYASVYVIPSKDTTITNFTLTDAEGKAKLEDVPFGSYMLRVEMMGYKPFVKEKYFRNRYEDMGTVRLKADEQFLEAAVINDVGNPIIVKQDTIEFNASSYRVGSNAMLRDLLKRMPGMEITDDGKVRFNGETVDKLTIGGRTFFFGDQSTALNNLPAAIVDKIRVIDRDSEETRATGVQDGTKEKVLDVALKKEYEKGWFGNVGLKGGTTAGKKDGDDMLRDNRGLLYSGNALAAAYGAKDQLTLIANGQNINDSNGVIIVYDDDGGSVAGQGLSTAAQLGMNVNTDRIKDVESTVSVNYKYSDTDSGSRSLRTTYQDDGNLSGDTQNNGKAIDRQLAADIELKREKGKIIFFFFPSFRYNMFNQTSSSSSITSREGEQINSSSSNASSFSKTWRGWLNCGGTIKDLFGKKGRSFRVELYTSYSASDGESDQLSLLSMASGAEERRQLHYLNDGNSYYVNSILRYTEPIGDKLTLTLRGKFNYSHSGNLSDASDALGHNDYYSSAGKSDFLNPAGELYAQYRFAERSYLTLGGQVNGSMNRTWAKSYGIETITGDGDWYWFFSPYLKFQHNKDRDRFTASASGSSNRPSAGRMLPMLNIANPSRLSLGNVYLKSSGDISFNADWSHNDTKRFSSLMLILSGNVSLRPVVSAQWYDADGILYSIPVNAQKPSFNTTFYSYYTTPLDSKKLWSLSLSGSVSYMKSVSYQTAGTLPGLDRDTFDYNAFMDGFWGDDGVKFYDGESGFKESNTRTLMPSVSMRLRYNQQRYSFTVAAGSSGRVARYSLNPAVNMNTFDSFVGLQGTYTTKHEFEFDTNISYAFYNGYPEGYGQPEWRWNASVSKNIGAFNLSVTVHDILNQTRNLTHTVTANYEEDSYRLIMGRYILFGVKWNFGKMNATHSNRARQAAMNMAF